MQQAYDDGLVIQTKPGAVPQLKRYLDEQRGVPLGDVWTDIPPINSQAQERWGYPTQKPIALLERMIQMSTRKGEVVLDPFCGGGTTMHAAQKLGRQWIGIDITHLAISLTEKRLRDAFPGIKFEVHGAPVDLGGAEALAAYDKHQFQWWAVSLVNAQPYGGKKKGADTGIDGIIYCRTAPKKTERMIVSVKGGQKVGVEMVRDLRAVIERENSPIGLLVTLVEPTGPMQVEAAKAGFYKTEFGEYPRLQILTVGQLLNGHRPQLPLVDTQAMFKKAPAEKAPDMQAELAI